MPAHAMSPINKPAMARNDLVFSRAIAIVSLNLDLPQILARTPSGVDAAKFNELRRNSGPADRANSGFPTGRLRWPVPHSLPCLHRLALVGVFSPFDSPGFMNSINRAIASPMCQMAV